MVHVTDNSHSKYGLTFVKIPSKEEMYNVMRHLIYVNNICGERKNYNLDNPTLTIELNSQDVDLWLDAINTEYKIKFKGDLTKFMMKPIIHGSPGRICAKLIYNREEATALNSEEISITLS